MAGDLRRQHRDTLLARIVEFRSGLAKFSDIDVNVAGTVFKCHRLVLSAASEYFNAMFSGNFNESSKSEITLHGIEANVFEVILQFLYTGDLSVNSLNLYDLICAAEYYQLSIAKEMCIAFLQKNLNAVAKDVLKIYSFAHTAGNEKLVQILSSHIYKQFGYFSKTPEYSQLTFDSLMKVFCQTKSTFPILQDIYVEGIFLWITSHQGLSLAEKESYFIELLRKIDFGKLSAKYIENKLTQNMKNLFVSSTQSSENVNDNKSCSYIEVHGHAVSLNAYMSTHLIGDFAEEKSMPVSIFTRHKRVDGFHTISNNSHDWLHSGELEFSSDFLRGTVVDKHLYLLSYSKTSNNGSGPEQIFCCGSSPSLYPYKSLKPPPIILSNFCICGEIDDIFVCSQNIPVIPNRFSGDSTFNEHNLKCDIFMYKRDVDRWFQLPSPKPKYCNPHITYFGKILYLFDDVGSNFNEITYQAYDLRTKEWVTVPCTTGTSMKSDQVRLNDPVLNNREPNQENFNPDTDVRYNMEALDNTCQIYSPYYKFDFLTWIVF